jgi:2-oxoisovalerate dehydrogenase E1 component
VVHEAVVRGGYGAEVLARLQELDGQYVPVRARRLATPNVRMPASPVLQAALLPSAASIVAAARELAAPAG